jgi:CRISPR-associated endonuclease/helicase Cas3
LKKIHAMNYSDFFQKATGHLPYPYQTQLAQGHWPNLLDIPTGLGKTAAVTLAWLYRRRQLGQEDMPRRLVWCLPMRVLVEQTVSGVETWLDNLGLLGHPEAGKISVHKLLGGESRADLTNWSSHPEADAILVGTQDMLLSRALMRGYGMSRFRWPVDFALLHSDALWVFDEVQLMGAGLATSAQLEGLRRQFPCSRPGRSLWLSATLNRRWLDTIDLRAHLESLEYATIDDDDRQAASNRIESSKPLQKAPLSLTAKASKKQGFKEHIEQLAQFVLDEHESDAQTLVIVNRVDRAQALFRALRKVRPEASDLLVHARFRAAERERIQAELGESPVKDRIVVATQAIEAGVDISSRVLITELAPWASMVQRFGRCNRYGEWNENGQARIHWIDIEDEADLLPYDIESLADSRGRLLELDDAGPSSLPPTDQERPLTPVLRCKDLLELFNTDPDLSGFDVDVSDFIRDSGLPSFQVFWREFDNPNEPEPQPPPQREELCSVSITQGKQLGKRKPWRWDSLAARWRSLNGPPRPGMQLMLASSDGGYDSTVGLDLAAEAAVQIVAHEDFRRPERFDGDDLSFLQRAIELNTHLGNVARTAAELCQSLSETEAAPVIIKAGRWHDVGKAHNVFQNSMHTCSEAPAGLLAKSNCPGRLRHERPHFRHELASMLAWLQQHDDPESPDPEVDLIAYLIAAHHGKIRTSLRAMPDEKPLQGSHRFARGIHEGDALPAFDFDGEQTDELSLNLAIMELGLGEMGRSWTERVQHLLEAHGPFRLAWLEALVRIADWKASSEEQNDEE